MERSERQEADEKKIDLWRQEADEKKIDLWRQEADEKKIDLWRHRLLNLQTLDNNKNKPDILPTLLIHPCGLGFVSIVLTIPLIQVGLLDGYPLH